MRKHLQKEEILEQISSNKSRGNRSQKEERFKLRKSNITCSQNLTKVEQLKPNNAFESHSSNKSKENPEKFKNSKGESVCLLLNHNYILNQKSISDDKQNTQKPSQPQKHPVEPNSTTIVYILVLVGISLLFYFKK